MTDAWEYFLKVIKLRGGAKDWWATDDWWATVGQRLEYCLIGVSSSGACVPVIQRSYLSWSLTFWYVHLNLHGFAYFEKR